MGVLGILSIIALVLSIISGFAGAYFLGKRKGRDEAIKRIESKILRVGPHIDN